MIELKNYKRLDDFIHPEGQKIVLTSAIFTFIFILFYSKLAWATGIFTLFSIYFFRNPIRAVPENASLIISPADGIVLDITEMEIELPNFHEQQNSNSSNQSDKKDEDEIKKVKMNRISIFLSISDVHVNRIPTDAEVIYKKHHQGTFLSALSEKSSMHNERVVMYLKKQYNDAEFIIGVTQIAGLIPRRIINECELKNLVNIGDKFGIIKYGSRVDLYLPVDLPIFIKSGQTCVGGETVISSVDSSMSEIFLKFK